MMINPKTLLCITNIYTPITVTYPLEEILSRLDQKMDRLDQKIDHFDKLLTLAVKLMLI